MKMLDSQTSSLRNLSPLDVQEAMARENVVLVDVRELGEFEMVRIEGAVLQPLSSFAPAAMPPGEVILLCAAGKRSAMAAALCAKAGVTVAGHLAGGMSAWMAAGLPVSYD